MAVTYIKGSERAEIFKKARSVLFEFLETVNKEQIVIALPGGRSVVGFMHALEKGAEALPMEVWQKLHFFMIDERQVPIDSEDSNFKLVNELGFMSFIAKGLITEDQVHPIVVGDDVESALAHYEEDLEIFGGVFDVAVLGVGEDGHVAGLFPNHSCLDDKKLGYLSFNDSPKPPAERITASLPLVKSAEITFVLFLGEGKQDAFNRYRDDSISLSDCPVKLANQINQTIIVTDLE